MNRLKGRSFYLAGPIEHTDDCMSWRQNISEFLWGVGAGVLDPCNKPFNGFSEDDVFRQKMMNWKQNGEFNELSSVMREIVTEDLHMVDLSTAVILYIDKTAHMCGSYFEACYACLERKPLIVCCKQGKSEVPGWLFGISKHELFFSTFYEVKNYLISIDQDKVINTLGGRWKFVKDDIVFGR